MEKLIWTDEDKFFITTFNKRLYDDYAHKFLQTYAETNQTIKMICYVEEDYQSERLYNLYPDYKGITYVNNVNMLWHNHMDYEGEILLFLFVVFLLPYHTSHLLTLDKIYI